ncbi:MAG: MFS transporter, partial [Hyphomicrobiales bacterium]|nr:MFS transporter [Hyphomicrobiales bacterium]
LHVGLASLRPGLVTSRHAALITFALAVGSFGIGTGEFAIMGLLPDVAGSLHVSEPEAGHLISAYALGVVIGAPMIALLAAKTNHRTMLLLLMIGFAAANLVSAAAPGITTLTVTRFLSGLPHGAYIGVAALVAAAIARADQRAQAVGRVLLGFAVATLIGTPLAAWLGQHFGWRSLFLLVGAIGALTVVLLWLTLPKEEPHEGASASRELVAFARPQVLLTFAFTAIGFGGMFAVFTYIAVTATRVAGLPVSFIPIILAIFGLGMMAGMQVGAWLADHWLMKTLGGVLSFNVLVFAAFALTAHHAVALCLMVFFIGCGAALAPAVQTRLMDVAGHAQTLAAASMHSAFNLANALGAWLGGLAIAAGYGYASTGWVGVVLGLAGLCVFVVSCLVERRGKGNAPALS